MGRAVTCPWCPGAHDARLTVDGPDSGAGPRVSVVVGHFEQPRELARTLAALARQDRPAHEVVVSDDGSALPPTVPAGVRLVAQPDLGFRAAAARNRGAAAATGDVLVFLDADTTPEPDYLRHLVADLVAEPDLLVVGRRRHTRFDGLDPADPLAGAEDHALEEPAWLADGWRATDGLRAADEGSFRYVISATAACTAAWFARVGGFDEAYVGYGGEDWDLAHRWWTAGGRLRHAPDAVAWHDGEHAGAGERAAVPDGDRRTAEAVALARTVNAAPVSFRGLRSAPARVVLTHDEALTDRQLVVAVDGFLAAAPQADVVSPADVWAPIGDPRVRDRHGPSSHRAALRVHLHRGVLAEPGAWADLLAVGAGGATRRELAVDGEVAVTLTDLRRLRRAHLGIEAEEVATAAADRLRSAAGVPLDAWLGGWA